MKNLRCRPHQTEAINAKSSRLPDAYINNKWMSVLDSAVSLSVFLDVVQGLAIDLRTAQEGLQNHSVEPMTSRVYLVEILWI